MSRLETLLASIGWKIYKSSIKAGLDPKETAETLLKDCPTLSEIMDEHEEMAR